MIGGGRFLIRPEGLMTGLPPAEEEFEDIGDLFSLSPIVRGWSSSNEMLTWGMTMFGGILLCFTSFFARAGCSVLASGALTGLHKFSQESYSEVMMMGMSEGEAAMGDLQSTELELDITNDGI